jgi:transposase-like protein
MTQRAAPFHCPYCGDEDLRPFGDGHGDWRCGSCHRAFRLKYLGLIHGTDEPLLEATEIHAAGAIIERASEARPIQAGEAIEGAVS